MKKNQWFRMTSALLMLVLVMAGSQTVKAAESQLLEAQQQIVSGNLDSGLQTLRGVLSQVTPDLAGRVSFIEKLVEIRVADMLNDQTKVAASLKEAVTLATQPDQMEACWQLGFALAKAGVSMRKASAAELLEFLSTEVAPGLGQTVPHIELAKLYIAVGNAVEAEAELTKAAPNIQAGEESGAWAGVVADLTKVSRSGGESYQRLREAVKPTVQAEMDIAKFKTLMESGDLEVCLEILKRLTDMVAADALTVLPLGYELSSAFARCGNTNKSVEALAVADAFAESLPNGFVRNEVLIAALTANGHADRAANLAWETVMTVRDPEQKQELLSLYAQAAVLVGREWELLENLQMMNARASTYTAAAYVLAGHGKIELALALVEAASFPAIVADGKSVGDVIQIMERVQQQRKIMAERQASFCNSLADEFAAAAEQAKQAGDGEKTERYTNRAGFFQTLAGEMDKDK